MSTKLFWKEEEIETCKTILTKIKSVPKAAKILSPKLGRTVAAITIQLYKIKNNIKTVSKTEKIKEITLPTGFELSVEFNKAVIQKNRIILYF